jgi:hypothetical protein
MTDLLKSPVVVSAALVVPVVLLFEGSAGLVVVAFLALWWGFLYRRSKGRSWNSFQPAITATAAAVLFLGAGSIGYTLSRHERFVEGTAWADGVIWWEIALGVALLPLAAHLWRRGFRSMQPTTRSR